MAVWSGMVILLVRIGSSGVCALSGDHSRQFGRVAADAVDSGAAQGSDILRAFIVPGNDAEACRRARRRTHSGVSRALGVLSHSQQGWTKLA